MTIRVVCQKCGAKLDIREELAGSTRRCPKCKTEFTVPPAVDELDDGVSLGTDDEELAESGEAEPKPDEKPVVPVAAAVESRAADEDSDDDDGEEDYMPSFMTAPAEKKSERKTPLPATTKKKEDDDDEDDEPVFSIPKAPA